jgi:hypothetical protein
MTRPTPAHPWRGWLRELVEARGNELQIAQYVAVRAGIRRSLDDWIRVARFDSYQRLMDRLGLIVLPDCVFHSYGKDGVAGTELTPTTRASGFPFSSADEHPPDATVHVIVSRRSDWAQAALASAWYPLAVRGLIVPKPLIDFRRLGLAFGYPECCVDFFLRHNDWPRQNTLVEAARVSERFLWQNNCLLKSTPWMLIFHMPCSFDCEPTSRQASAILEALRETDSQYAQRIESELQQLFLTISERVAFALRRGRRDKDRAWYESAVDLHRTRSFQEDWERHYKALVTAGDELRIEDGLIYVYRRGHLVETLATRCDRGVAEVPLLLDFRRED